MSCIIYITNKKNQHMYAYESTSYRDPVTHKPRSRRKYLGRVDPITKEFINPRSETRNVSDVESPHDSASANTDSANKVSFVLEKEILKLQTTTSRQQEVIDDIRKEVKELKKLFDTIARAINASAR